MSYTSIALLALGATILLDVVVLRTRLLTRKLFWTAYAIVALFQLVTNGVLTGWGVVRYDPHTIVGWRFVYAPVEDLAFGFALVTQTLCWWVWWGRRMASSGAAPRVNGGRETRGRGRG